MGNHLITKIIIVGAGNGGKSLIDFFLADPTIKIIGVVDLNDEAPGIKLAKQSGIATSDSFLDFLKNVEEEYDIILEVTGKYEVGREISATKPLNTRLISGIAARFVWALLEERSNNTYIKEKYQKISSLSKNNNDILFGSSPLMAEIRELIAQVAPTQSSVLITGETGTGKELVAEMIHSQSGGQFKSLVKVNCTAFTDEIIESELFGHVKGSFTGAISDKKGLLETADGGMLFLDEIGDIPITTQVKLLRFLQFGEVRPVGSNTTKNVEARIVAATNRDLKQLIEQERFRQDLFFRLNTFVIDLPPLRKRKEDIPLYTYHFLKKAVLKLNKRVERINSKVLDMLIQYDWPGNLRELQGVIERAVILCNGPEITPSNLPLNLQSEQKLNLKLGFNALREGVNNAFEQETLIKYLIQNEGNVTQAALHAKIPRRTFYRMLEKHHINPKELIK